MKPRVISLCRLSTAEQDQEGRAGLMRQTDINAVTVERCGLNVKRTEEIVDVSGTQVSENSQFQGVLDSLRSNEVDGVVVSAMDRLVRPDDFSAFGIYDVFLKYRKLIWLPSGVIDVSQDSGFLEALVTGMMAGLDRRRILRITQEGKETNRRRGRCANSKITLPFGVDFDFETGNWSYKQPYKTSIPEAYHLFLSGESIRSIARKLGYACSRTLYNHLRNPIWMGVREYRYKRGSEKYPSINGKQSDRKKIFRPEPLRVSLKLQPLVTAETFALAQQKLSVIGSGWASSRSSESRCEAKGLLFCSCGQRFYAKADKRRGKGGGYYYCKTQHQGGRGCGAPKVQQELFDHSLAAFVSEFFKNPAVLEVLLHRSFETTFPRNIRELIQKGESELKRLDSERTRLIRLVRKNVATDEDIEEELLAIASERQTFEAALARNKQQLESATYRNLGALAQALTNLFAEVQFLVPSERKRLLKICIAKLEIRDRHITAVTVRVPNGSFSAKMRSHTDKDSSRRRASSVQGMSAFHYSGIT